MILCVENGVKERDRVGTMMEITSERAPSFEDLWKEGLSPMKINQSTNVTKPNAIYYTAVTYQFSREVTQAKY